MHVRANPGVKVRGCQCTSDPGKDSIIAKTPVEVKQTSLASDTRLGPWQAPCMEMDRLFDRFSSGWRVPAEPAFGMASPAVDITADDAAFRVTAELPGMTEKDSVVVLSDGMLTLKGEKRQEKEQKDKTLYLSERSYGAFQRSFTLPEGVDPHTMVAEFGKGVLKVTLPKTAKAKQQTKIDVKAAA